MSRAKRPYVPKTKGCYECSQRRVNCDRNEPRCDKCVSRGLECSGLRGPHFRFRNRFAVPAQSQTNSPSPPRSRKADAAAAATNTTAGDPRRDRLRQRSDARSISTVSDAQYQGQQQYVEQQQQSSLFLSTTSSSIITTPVSAFAPTTTPDASVANPEMAVMIRANAERLRCTAGPVIPPITLISDAAAPWQRFLFKHFSDHIAPEMVIIDRGFNGWRHLVLPMACQDDLLMWSVLAVAAFHHSSRVGAHHPAANPTSLASKAIYELQRRRNLVGCGLEERYRVIMAIIVLLLATMVNGNSDFPIILRMLKSALALVTEDASQALSGTMQTLAEFAAKQIRKMRVFASPFLSVEAGISAVAAQATQCWDTQEQALVTHPDHSSTLPVISNLRQIAFQIYLHEATPESRAVLGVFPDLLLEFRQLLHTVPEAVPGEHTLIWPVFMAAAASYKQEDREFYAQFLERQLLRSGWENILKALQCLRRIWSRDPERDWVSMLPEQGVFVM